MHHFESAASARSLAVALLMLATFASPSAAQKPGTIQGAVRTAEGQAVPGAEVRLTGEGSTVRTDPEGSFAFTGLAPGSYLVVAETAAVGAASLRVELRPGANEEVVLELSPAYHLDPLVVTAASRSRRSELARSATVLDTEALQRAGRASLGETLAREPGMSSTFFGPGASRPVVRGLGGDRVRILENDLDVGDASSNSPDHAVSIDPLTTDRVEILRGPASLLYGGAAVGGVVNAIDGRIAREPARAPFSLELRGRGGTVADELDGGARLELASGPLVLHASGSWLDQDDYTVPEAPTDADEHQGDEDDEHGPETAAAGALENSSVATRRGSLGASLVGERGYLGAAFTAFDSEYGVPAHDDGEAHGDEEAAHGHGSGEEAASVDLRQRRFDVAGALRFGHGVVRAVEARFGLTDYEHDEIEGDAIGTTALNDQWNARVALPHRLGASVSGSLGAEIGHRAFSKLGVEAFVPPTRTDSWALFAVEDVRAGRLTLQVGARLERQDVEAAEVGAALDFGGVALSAGLNWLATDQVVLALSATRSEKAPSAENLFANGAHIAQRTFEIGDATLREEVAHGIEGSVRWTAGALSGEVTGYVTDFDGFLFLRDTPDFEDGFPVFEHAQADARFSGFEAEARAELLHSGATHVGVRAWSDYVRGTLVADDSALPRIPPLRLGGGIEAESGALAASLDVRRVFEQDRTARFEEPTAGFTMVDASLSYRLSRGGATQEIGLQGVNLGDVFARNHVSFLRSDAPLPGRELRLTYRVLF